MRPFLASTIIVMACSASPRRSDSSPIDVAYRAATDSLFPFVRARDSALAAARKDSGSSKADQGFVDATNLLRNQVPHWLDSLFPHPSGLYSRDSLASDTIEEFLADRSLLLEADAGYTSLRIDDGPLWRQFAPWVTPAMREFITIASRELEETNWAIDDDRVPLRWDSIAVRLATWERFAKTYPSFVLSEKVEETASRYRNLFLIRTYESFPEFSRELDPELGEAYRQFAKRYPETPTGQLIARYLRVLKANDFTQSSTADSLLSEAGVGSTYPTYAWLREL